MNHEKWTGLERTITSDYGNMTGIVVLQNGITKYKNYFNGYTPDDPEHIASVTKSVFSALIGIALEKGYIKSIDQHVLEFFPDYKVVNGEETIQYITLRHLLTMTAPYKYETEPYEQFFSSENWTKAALDLLGGDGRIGDFLYSALIGTHILSGILTNAARQSILQFASQNLFSPLGINIKNNIVFHTKEEQIAWYAEKKTSGWVVDPQGINTAGWGLCMTPVEMAKIGQLYLNRGSWEGRQIIPASWVEETTREHSHWGMMKYGCLWWIIDGKDRVYAALGDGGNVIYINEKKNLVVSIASLFMPDARDRIEFIQNHIEPIVNQ